MPRGSYRTGRVKKSTSRVKKQVSNKGRAISAARNKGQRGRLMSGRGKPTVRKQAPTVSTTPRRSTTGVSTPIPARRMGPVPSVQKKLHPVVRRGRVRRSTH